MLPVSPPPKASMADTDCLYRMSYVGRLRESFSNAMSILSGTSSTSQMSPSSFCSADLDFAAVCFFGASTAATFDAGAATPRDAGVTWLDALCDPSTSSCFSMSAKAVILLMFMASITNSQTNRHKDQPKTPAWQDSEVGSLNRETTAPQAKKQKKTKKEKQVNEENPTQLCQLLLLSVFLSLPLSLSVSLSHSLSSSLSLSLSLDTLSS